MGVWGWNLKTHFEHAAAAASARDFLADAAGRVMIMTVVMVMMIVAVMLLHVKATQHRIILIYRDVMFVTTCVTHHASSITITTHRINA